MKQYPALGELLTRLYSWRSSWQENMAWVIQRFALNLLFGYVLLVIIGAIIIYATEWDRTQKAAQYLTRLFPYPAVIIGPAKTTSNPLRYLSIRFIPIKDIRREAAVLTFFDRQTKGEADERRNEQLATERTTEAVLIEREAKRLGITISTSQAEQDFVNLTDSHGGRVAFTEQVLKKLYGVSDRFFIDRWVTEKLYRVNLLSVKARHILIGLPNPATASQEVEGKKRIDQIKKRIVEGQPFDQVAKEFSEDAATREQGGAIGFFGNGDVASRDFENAALIANPGDLVGPVRTEFGWHLILIEEKKGPLQSTAFTTWLDDVKSKSKVWILDPTLRSTT